VNSPLKAESLIAKLERTLKERFPHWGLSKLAVVGHGIEFLVLRSSSRLHGEVALRIPWTRIIDNDNDEVVDCRDLLKQEYLIAGHLHARGIPVPRPLALDVGSDDAADFLMSLYIASDKSTPNQELFGELLAKVHAVAPPTFVPAMARQKDSNEAVAVRLLRRCRNLEKVVNDKIKLPSLDEIQSVLQGRCFEKRLLHMDAREANLITQKNEIMAIVDWSNALVGDPLLEICRILEYGHYSTPFVKGYGDQRVLERLNSLEGLIFRLDTAIVLSLLFYSQVPDREMFRKHVQRSHDLVARIRMQM